MVILDTILIKLTTNSMERNNFFMNNNNVMIGGSLSGIEVEKRDNRPRNLKRVPIGPSLKEVTEIMSKTNDRTKLSYAQKEIERLEQKVKDLEEEIRRKDALSIEKDKQIHRLKEDKEMLCSELMLMNSKEFRENVGGEFLKTVIEELLKDSDDWDQIYRRESSNVLQGLCLIDGVPKEVKKMIQSLKKKSRSSNGTTVIAQNGSTVNNNDIHNNNTVNTK